MNFDIYATLAIFLTLAISLAYINHRFIKMQPSIAIMFASLLISLAIIIASQYFKLHYLEVTVQQLLNHLDFKSLLLNGMLSFLLFAGAITVDLAAFKEQQWEIGILASLGTLASTFLIGTIVYYLFILVSLTLPYLFCLVFGALISPTDPIAVLAMCKDLKAPRQISVTIAGESLFNDGMGIVIFITLFQLMFSHSNVTSYSVIFLFFREAIGGIIFGAIAGALCYWLIKPLHDHKVEILVTIALTTGGYALAQYLEISGPLAMVVAGIFLGNTGTKFKLPRSMSQSLFTFWEVIDELLNIILFLLIGFELLVIPLDRHHLTAALLCIPIVIFVRFIVVSVPLSIFKIWREYSPHFIKVMTWGGLRGGLAVALSLSLPPSTYRDYILAMTYAVVIFSIIIQGTSIKSLVQKTSALR